MKNKLINTVLLALSAMLCFVPSGCDPIDYSTPVYGPGDIYFAGSQSGSDGDTTRKATYWKNGVAVPLTNGSYNASLIDVVVSNGDVHALGYEGNSLMYWKNGVPTNLGDSLTAVYNMCVSNGNTYILARSGRSLGGPVVIRNGELLHVALQGATPGECIHMAVSGNDIYLAGYVNGFSGITPMLWKNGIPIITTSTSGWCSGVTVAGSDVYASATLLVNGTSPMEAAYWKNGQLVMLTDETHSAGATGVFVSGNDVYIAGWENENEVTKAKYWKNDIDVVLPFDGSTQATEIAVSGSDVYVAGNNIINGDAILWKNGTIVPPFTGVDNQILGNNLWVD